MAMALPSLPNVQQPLGGRRIPGNVPPTSTRLTLCSNLATSSSTSSLTAPPPTSVLISTMLVPQIPAVLDHADSTSQRSTNSVSLLHRAFGGDSISPILGLLASFSGEALRPRDCDAAYGVTYMHRRMTDLAETYPPTLKTSPKPSFEGGDARLPSQALQTGFEAVVDAAVEWCVGRLRDEFARLQRCADELEGVGGMEAFAPPPAPTGHNALDWTCWHLVPVASGDLMEGVHFQPFVLGATDSHNENDNPKSWTLDPHMSLNGHTFIDILKIDIESREPNVFTTVLSTHAKHVPSRSAPARDPRVRRSRELCVLFPLVGH
ncbi:hypothetical protein BJY52DRAFT_1190462 [Lactarius psammicola]|nr:hypothetical protein BJY52DRAFT_1190462 [Lactarius psammicola]